MDIDHDQSSTQQTDNSALSELSEMELRILQMAQKRPRGITDKDINTDIPELPLIEKVKIINNLLSKGFLNLFQQGNTLLYKVKGPSAVKNEKFVDNEEKIVYSVIEASGNKGIWIRDIRQKTNLVPKKLAKSLKNLETKKFIKVVKSVAAGKRKMYMIYNIEPDNSVTGGAWYQDQDFEAEFVDILRQQCYNYLEKKRDNNKNCGGGPIVERNETYASSKDVWKYISELGISKVQLSIDDIEMILNTLVYDGKVEQTHSIDGDNLYRAINSLLSSPGLIKTPCGICPVRKNCDDLGDVTPFKCQYVTDWLQ